MLRCAITSGDFPARHGKRWASQGVELVQLRAKTLEAGGLATLGRTILNDIALAGYGHTQLLVNGRADVAAAIGAAGVHLTAAPDELTPADVRRVFTHAGRSRPVVSVSCHTADEVCRARDNGAEYILFGPVFEKRVGDELVSEGVGLQRLREACHLARAVPVLALGGITAATTDLCIAAGAAGVAGIRLFD
jgi:thiamine-phosphate pyrophosphorylase